MRDRGAGDGPIWCVLAVREDAFLIASWGKGVSFTSLRHAAECMDLSNDGGKTWQPCYKEVE